MTDVDELFIFLEPGADPTTARATDGGTLLVWAPDGAAAARVAAEQAESGVRLIELYRGFDLGSATQVVDAVAGRAPVGVSAYGFGHSPDVDRIARSAAIYGSPGADPDSDRIVRDSERGHTTVVPAPDTESVVRTAIELSDQGAEVIELCGGTPLTTAGRVQEAVGHRTAVSLVSWPFESIDGAAAYKAAYEAAA